MKGPDFWQVTHERYLRYLGLQIRLDIDLNSKVLMLFTAGAVGRAFTFLFTCMIMLLVMIMLLLAGNKGKELDHRLRAATQNAGKHPC